jgi:hypothetical protein
MISRNMRWLLIAAALFVLLAGASPQAADHKISLGEPVPLRLRYPTGETIHYKLLRHSIFFQMDGTRFGEHRAAAYFTRTRLPDDSAGRIQERFTWEAFSFGETMMPNKPLEMAYLKEAEGFSLRGSVEDHEMIDGFDFSGLPRTIQGLWFMIMSWDAVTFDGLTRPQEHFDFPDSATIGTSVESTQGPYDFQFEYPPIVADSKYHFSGNSTSRLIGVSMVKGIPCAIVEFSTTENTVEMNMQLAPFAISSTGFEHLWGRTYLSLEDGRVVKGEAVAPVTQVQTIRMPDQDRTQHGEFLVVQQLEMDMLSPEQFEKEVSEQRPADR